MSTALRFIVLSSTKVGESSLVINTLSAEYGRRGFITSVSRSGGMALFLPLNILEGEVIENRRSDLWRLRGLTSLHPLDGLRSDVRKNTMSLFMSEVLLRCLGEGASEEGLAAWCERSVLTLDALESDFSNFHLRWLLELCGALGFDPSPEGLAPFLGGGFLPAASLLCESPSQALVVPLNGEKRSVIASGILDYLSFHLGTPLNVRSLKILSELYK